MPYVYFLLGVILSVSVASGGLISGAPEAISKAISAPISTLNTNTLALADISAILADIPSQNGNFREVPFYSQFEDISDPEWQKLGCGIADLAMLIELYKPGVVSVDALLQEGIDSGAFINGAGWSHAGLVTLAGKYGLTGQTYDFSGLDKNAAFTELAKILQEGPVIVSVYYKFEFGNPIPHLAVITGISNGKVFYNDPAEASGGYEISIEDFQKAWKKRGIAIRP